MDTREFEAQLRRDGYLEIKNKSIEPHFETTPHCHAFDTRLLVLEGEATIVYDDRQRTYKPGDVMEIDAGVMHCERHGAARFESLVGLRHKPVEAPSEERKAAAALNPRQ